MSFFKFYCLQSNIKQRIADNRPRLYRMAFAWGHNDDLANEIVQETMTKALSKLHQLKDIQALDAWLFGILTNCWRDHFRRLKETVDVDEIVLEHHNTPESITQRQDIVDQVRMAITKLPQGQRQVLTMVDLEGFSYAEVAAILSIPVGTVMSRLSRARKQLADHILQQKNAHHAANKQLLRRVK